MSEHVLIGLTAILALGIGSQWLAWRLRVPAILVLLIVGCLAGAGSEWLSARTGWPHERLLDPNKLFGDLLLPIVSLSVALILFEGGLTLAASELSVAGGVIARLVSVGAIVTWLLAAAATHFLIGLAWPLAILLGAILVVTGPTVIGPLLRHVRPTGRVGPILKWEGIVIDPIGAMLAVLAFEAIPLHQRLSLTAVVLFRGVLQTLIVSLVIGAGGAAALVLVLRRRWVPDYLQTPVTLAIVIGAFTACNAIQPESGLFAATLMGVILANQRFASVHHIAEFKETLTVLLISALFIVIGSRISLDQLHAMGWSHLALVLVLVLVVRPAAVFISTIGAGLTLRERTFIACMAPRGVVAAAVTSVFALRLSSAGIHGAAALGPTIFAVIIGSVAIYGLTAAPLARALGLAKPESLGLLIVGASPAARMIASALHSEGVDLMLVDTNRQNIADARLEGLPVHFGSVNSEQIARRIELSGIGRLVALTPNEEVNALASIHFARIFGRSEVFQLASKTDAAAHREKVAHGLRGRGLFAADLTYAELNDRVARGATVKKTRLTDAFTLSEFKQTQGPQSVPLFLIGAGGAVSIVTADDPIAAKAGQTLVYLTEPK